MKTKKKERVFFDFLWVFLVPMVFNKFFFVYFAMAYSKNPGRGYGYTTLVFLTFLIINMGLFLWKYSDYNDEEQ